MRIRNALTALALACVSLTLPAFADSDAIRVDVPFAFFAGAKKLTAGQYTLRVSESGQTLFLLGSVESSIVSVLPSTVTEASPGLVFKRDEGSEYLVSVQTSGMECRAIPMRRLE